VDERTNEERTAKSNTDGAYEIVALKPSLTIKVRSGSIAPAEQTRLQLTVGQEIHRNFICSSLTFLHDFRGWKASSPQSIPVLPARKQHHQREVMRTSLKRPPGFPTLLQAPGSTTAVMARLARSASVGALWNRMPSAMTVSKGRRD